MLKSRINESRVSSQDIETTAENASEVFVRSSLTCVYLQPAVHFLSL